MSTCPQNAAASLPPWCDFSLDEQNAAVDTEIAHSQTRPYRFNNENTLWKLKHWDKCCQLQVLPCSCILKAKQTHILCFIPLLILVLLTPSCHCLTSSALNKMFQLKSHKCQTGVKNPQYIRHYSISVLSANWVLPCSPCRLLLKKQLKKYWAWYWSVNPWEVPPTTGHQLDLGSSPPLFLFLFLWLEMALRKICCIIFPQTNVSYNFLLFLKNGLYAFLQS